MIRDAQGNPLALPLAKLPSVPVATGVSDLTRHLRRAPDPLYATQPYPTDISTAQSLLRRYVENSITKHCHRGTITATLDTVGTRFPHFGHEISVTKQIYNLPPFEIARRTRSIIQKTYPGCSCVKCGAEKAVHLYLPPEVQHVAGPIAEAPRTEAARTVSSASSEGSAHTTFSLSFFDSEVMPDDPPPPYSAFA